MKTLSVCVAVDDLDAELLLTKFSCKELEGIIQRESHHVLAALVNELKQTIPLVQDEDERLEHSL
jgi:hypothetical protein